MFPAIVEKADFEMKFKKTIIDRARLGVACRRFASSLKEDFINDFLQSMVPTSWCNAVRRSQEVVELRPPFESETPIKPTFFVSYATDWSLKGSHRFCGGEKLLNNLVLMLRRRGYEAYMVSLDGRHADWLAEHAPFLSIDEFKTRKETVTDARFVSSWVKARPFLNECPRFYFWDQELAASSRSHFPELASMVRKRRIIRTAGVNRAVQAFHRCVFETEAMALRQLIDNVHWKPAPSRRVRNRIGYFDEGDHGASYVRRISELTAAAGFGLEFVQLAGVEREIIRQMQQCGVFMALNIGKSHLWGEGGPMSPQEAMACGTVPVCFDINGPWELIQQDYNGVIAMETTPESMAAALISIYSVAGRLEEMSRRTLEIFQSSHSMEARWPDVARFLDLPLQ